MKKYIIAGVFITGILFSGIQIRAKENETKSKGSIEGMVQLYAEDIKYLENEINQLVEECGGKISE